VSSLKKWVNASAENLEKYNRWLNDPVTAEILSEAAKDSRAVPIPYSLANGNSCTYLHGFTVGLQQMLEVLTNASVQKKGSSSEDPDYNTILSLINLGYKPEDARRIVKEQNGEMNS